jgi:CheY-like chemotaxis protein
MTTAAACRPRYSSERSIRSTPPKNLASLEKLQPDLILTDILMPQMDGVEIILALSQRSNTIPIIAMSGGGRAISSQFNLESASLLGVKAVLTKPFSHADLRRVIGTMLP